VKKSDSGTIVYHPGTKLFDGVTAPPATSLPSERCYGDFIGLAFYRREFLDIISADDFSIVPVWQRAVRQGIPIGVLECSTETCWRDAGSVQSLAQLHFDALEGKCAVDFPQWMQYDKEKRSACNQIMETENKKYIGNYCWVETPSIDSEGTVENCVILSGAPSPLTTKIFSNRFITPWGIFPVEREL
jgi:NDP-sugar pyrophosphorylase family protein